MAPTKTSSFEYDFPPLTQGEVDAFRMATHTQSLSTIPLTLATKYRKAEFRWLSEMGVDMRRLLHTDQEYEYREPLKVGDSLKVITTRTDVRERRGLLFVTLETDLLCSGVTKVHSKTMFVVRKGD